MMSLNRPGPAAMRSVATLLAMDRTTLTGCLKALERRGLVTVAADPEDRRARLLSLTPDGSALLALAVPIWMETHRAVEQGLTEGAPDRLRSDLLRLAEAG